MGEALVLHGATVRFPAFTLGPLDLTLATGRVVGLVGPNASGKTTLLRCVAGNLDLDAGLIEVHGRTARDDDAGWKAGIGYVSARPAFFEHLTAARNLELLARLHPRWSPERAADLVRRLRLDTRTRTADLSRGSLAKLALVAALAPAPRLLLLDEPAAGLDPIARRELMGILAELLEDDEVTVVQATHVLDDLHRQADELVFLRDGRIRLQVAKDDLTDSWRQLRFHHPEALDDLPGVQDHVRHGRVHSLITPDGEATRAELARRGAEAIRAVPLSLDEIAVRILEED